MTTCKEHAVKFHLGCLDCIAMIKEATWKGNDFKDTIKVMDKKGFIFEDSFLRTFRESGKVFE